MGLKLYTKLKIKLVIATSVLVVILLSILFVENYIFIYKSNYEHVNVHSENLYKMVSRDFNEDDFLYTEEGLNKGKHRKTETILENLINVYDIKSVYTLKKLDDGKIVYISYAEKGDNLQNYAYRITREDIIDKYNECKNRDNEYKGTEKEIEDFSKYYYKSIANELKRGATSSFFMSQNQLDNEEER